MSLQYQDEQSLVSLVVLLAYSKVHLVFFLFTYIFVDVLLLFSYMFSSSRFILLLVLSSCNHDKLRILNACVLIANTPSSSNLTRHGLTKVNSPNLTCYCSCFSLSHHHHCNRTRLHHRYHYHPSRNHLRIQLNYFQHGWICKKNVN